MMLTGKCFFLNTVYLKKGKPPFYYRTIFKKFSKSSTELGHLCCWYSTQKVKRLKKAECSPSSTENIPEFTDWESSVQYLKSLKLTTKDGVYLLNKKLEDTIIKHLTSNLKQTDLIIEANPGLGLLSQNLLNAGVAKLRIFEKTKVFIPFLKSLESKHPKQLDFFKEDILSLSKIEMRETFSGNEGILTALFSGMNSRDWAEEPALKFFAILPPKKECTFLRYLNAKVPTQSSIFSFGRVEFLLFVSGKEYLLMTTKKSSKYRHYRGSTMIYQLYYDVDLLHVEPKSSFYPQPTWKKTVRLYDYDTENMYLIKLTPKKDLLTLLPPEKLPELHYFIHYHMLNKRNFIIPTLEKWIPGCGIRLIKDGFTVFTLFDDLTPQEMVSLFKKFSSWPEYDASSFRSAVQHSSFRYSSFHDDNEEQQF